jgi:peptidoglycan-associated lipoprotein
MKLANSVSFVTLSLIAAAGCASSAPPPQSPASSPPVTSASQATAPVPVVVTEDLGPYNMYIADPILVTMTCSGPDPFFAFDVAKPLTADKPTMNNLVACLRTGPMQGKTVKLIGHTDPRGTAAFNERLGLQRAENVKKYLVANGIDAAHVVTASMGAEDAAKAPKAWATDRRVQIQVAP